MKNNFAIRLATMCCAVCIAGLAACASTQFDRAIDSHQWTSAAAALAKDTTILNSDAGLYKAAMLYTFPDRPTYDPARATILFVRLVHEYPKSSLRQEANDQLSLLHRLQKTSDDYTAQQQSLLARIAALTADTLRLRSSLDSMQEQNVALRKVTTRLESDSQDRESQLSELHSELNHLKAIDLGPRSRGVLADSALRKPIKP